MSKPSLQKQRKIIAVNIVDLPFIERLRLIKGAIVGHISVEIKPETLKWLKEQA